MSGDFNDVWGGVGMTLVDSLDTLWLMGLREEFEEAVQWVSDHLELQAASDVSVFEYNIRLLGGLLSAFDLSGDKRLLAKAVEVGDMLQTAFQDEYPLPFVALCESVDVGARDSEGAEGDRVGEGGAGGVRNAVAGVPLSLQALRQRHLRAAGRPHLRLREDAEPHVGTPPSQHIPFAAASSSLTAVRPPEPQPAQLPLQLRRARRLLLRVPAEELAAGGQARQGAEASLRQRGGRDDGAAAGPQSPRRLSLRGRAARQPTDQVDAAPHVLRRRHAGAGLAQRAQRDASRA